MSAFVGRHAARRLSVLKVISVENLTNQPYERGTQTRWLDEQSNLDFPCPLNGVAQMKREMAHIVFELILSWRGIGAL